jgi:hypothetical protein
MATAVAPAQTLAAKGGGTGSLTLNYMASPNPINDRAELCAERDKHIERLRILCDQIAQVELLLRVAGIDVTAAAESRPETRMAVVQ